jgi:cation transport ATPase
MSQSRDDNEIRDALVTKGASGPPSSSEGIDILKELVQLQREQLAVRQEEIGVQKQQVENAHEFALKNLDAQASDRKDARGHNKTERRDRLLFAGLIIAILILFIGAAIYMGQPEIAKEIVKAVVYLVAGGLGGYSYASQKRKREKPDS